MKKKYHILLTILCAFVLSAATNVLAQKSSKNTIESVVLDSNGKPLENVLIYSGRSFAKSDASGKFTIIPEAGGRIVFEKRGFDEISFTADEVTNRDFIKLETARFQYEKYDKTDLAFRKAFKGDVVGAVTKVSVQDVTQFDNTIWASEVLTGRTLGLLGSNNIRGLGIGINVSDITGSGLNSGNALFVVDGLPRDIQSLRLSEIDDITVLKDANSAALYGSAGVNGVVLITTKRGEAFKTKTDFTYNYGISTPKDLPEYLNSADYMTYYNQARVNDGLSPQFSDEEIENYRSGNRYRYPDVDYYSDDYMRSFKSYFDLMGEFSGGNNLAKFYSNVGWYSAGSILDFGEAKNSRNNVFNVRANVDLKINDWIKTSIDGSSLFANNRSQRGNFWGEAASVRPYELTPLLPFDLIDPENSLLTGRKNDVNDKYLLGGNSSYLTNAIADSYSGGQYENISRKFSFNNRIDVDLNKVLDGLSFHTNISFDYFTRYTQTIANTYSVYEPTWDATEDKIIDLKQHGVDTRSGTQVVGGTYFFRRFGFYGLLSYDKMFNEVHHFTGSLVGYGSNFKEQNNTSTSYDEFQGVKHAHLGLQLAYTYNKKYMADFSSAYVSSVKLAKGNRGGFSPTLGLAWIMSAEDFMSSIDAVDFLKVRLSGGVINSDIPIGGFFYYDNRYGGSGSYSWNEGQRSRGGIASSWTDNPNLGYAKRNEVNLGLEGLFFNKTIGAEVNLFYDLYNDLITRPTNEYPSFMSEFVPYKNYGQEVYKGVEFGLNLNKSVGNWSFFLGANMLYVTSERTKVDEVWDNDYQYRKGHPADATFGLEALGLFRDQADIDNSPLQAFGVVKPGDIKYKDQNGDGIVDTNDEVFVRRWQSPFSGGLQLKVSYKNLSLYVLGEGRSGMESFMEGDYYWVDGNNKYSALVRNSWTESTQNTASYPRLSSQTNNNNHRRSTYWLYNNDYFSIQKIQLTYKMPEKISKALMMKNMDVFVDASDVYEFSKNRKIRETRVNGEPYYRTFSIGVKASF